MAIIYMLAKQTIDEQFVPNLHIPQPLNVAFRQWD